MGFFGKGKPAKFTAADEEEDEVRLFSDEEDEAGLPMEELGERGEDEEESTDNLLATTRKPEAGREKEDEGDASWKTNAKLLSRLSAPVIVTFILELLPGLVNVMAVGHLGEVQLAAVTLGVMFCQVTGVAPALGMATGLDTLCSQAFGANKKKMMGVLLQRAMLLELLLCIPIALVWIFCGPILTLMGQDHEVIAYSTQYVWISLAGLYPFILFELLKKFLQSQHIVLPQMYIAIAANVFNIFGNWFLVFYLDWGFPGAPIARVITNWLLPLFTLFYIGAFKACRDCWDGWSKESLKGWAEFLYLGIPGLLMLCLEFWAFEAGALMAGLLGTTELAAQSIILNASTLTYFVPFGCSVATSVVIGNALGAGHHLKAKRLSRLALSFALCYGLCSSLLIISLKDYIPMVFTKEQAVIDLASYVFPVAAAFQLFDGICGICNGILRGCGQQKLGAISNFVGFYLIGLPFGAVLVFVAHVGLIGLWGGIAVALFIIAILDLYFVFRTDWRAQAKLASLRTGAPLPAH